MASDDNKETQKQTSMEHDRSSNGLPATKSGSSSLLGGENSLSTGQNFKDAFKSILSSVLKTDLGQVLKNRSEKQSSGKQTVDADKTKTSSSDIGENESTPEIPIPSERKEDEVELQEENKGTPVSNEEENTTEKNETVKPTKSNKARKSMVKVIPDEIEETVSTENKNEKDNASENGPTDKAPDEAPENPKPKVKRSFPVSPRELALLSSNVPVKRESRRSRRKFKGGTYQLFIRPSNKKKAVKKKPPTTHQAPYNSLLNKEVSLGNLEESEHLQADSENGDTIKSRSTESPFGSELSELQMSESSHASVSAAGYESELIDMDGDEMELGEQASHSRRDMLHRSLEEAAGLPSGEPHSPGVSESAKAGGNSVKRNSRKVAESTTPRQQPRPNLPGSDDNHLGELPGLTVDEALRMKSSADEFGLENMSVASSVKRRHGLKRLRGEGDDLDSLTSSWSNSSDQNTAAKRARRGMNGSMVFPPAVNRSFCKSNSNSSPASPQMTVPKQTMLFCTCKENVSATSEMAYTKEIYCQAIDCIDDRLVGCCNEITKSQLSRPSRKIPFIAMCDVHRYRLRAHQCCPGCGFFCTQGIFIQCRIDPRKSLHLFHERCCLVYEGEALCPHCAKKSDWLRVRLRLNAPRPPAYFSKQTQQQRQPSARMSICRGNDAAQPVDATDSPVVSYKIEETGKEISLAGLPMGPDRTELESLVVNLALEQSMSLRYTIKSMYNAAKSGDTEKILHMLAMGFDPNHKFEEHDNEMALHAACSSGHLTIVHVLLQAGASIDSLDDNLRTPLVVAVENKQLCVVHYLIRAGAHLEARGEDGMTVLHLAAKSGNLEACQIIIDTGKININIQDDGGWTPLVWGAEHRHRDIARFLLGRGSDPNVRDNEQNIALHWAAYSGSIDICELFLNHGCDLTSVNEHGDTPLHIAARLDNYECIILFLARNADITVRNKENDMPINCCPDQTSQSALALKLNHQLKHITGLRTTRSERLLHKDISRGKEVYAIQCVNGFDDEPLPTDYLYITESCETSPISIDRSITSLQYCNCEDDCSGPNCTCGSMSLKCWYTKEGSLISEFNLLDPPMIFECNRACQCWKDCNNRVVQHRTMCRLQLFRTQGKGWGVRTLRDIPQGSFICEYIGELISDSEADQREDDSYLFDLDNRDGETYCIDARHYGNISRFINHLCEPNLVPVKVFLDHQDLRFPRIAFFSSRAIKAYEELGFDYGEKFWIIKYKTFTCQCSSEKCKYSADKIQEMLDNYNQRQREEQINATV